MEDETLESFGPAMIELTDRQRQLVMTALAYPTMHDWQVAEAAGYSHRSHGALKVTAHRLFRSEKILAALHEEAGKRLRGSAVLGVATLEKIARTDGHPQQLRAAEALLNRIGLHERSEHKVTVERKDLSSGQMIERIRALAERLGVDASKLIGEEYKPMRTIMGEVVDVRRTDSGTIDSAPDKAAGVPREEPDGASKEAATVFEDAGMRR